MAKHADYSRGHATAVLAGIGKHTARASAGTLVVETITASLEGDERGTVLTVPADEFAEVDGVLFVATQHLEALLTLAEDASSHATVEWVRDDLVVFARAEDDRSISVLTFEEDRDAGRHFFPIPREGIYPLEWTAEVSA